MKAKIKFAFLGILVLACVFGHPSIGQADRTFLSEYTQVLYDKGNGIITNETNDILQTSDGYIWIASYSGLIQYDGTVFAQYSSLLDNFPSSSATSLMEDANQNLWIGTNDNGIVIHHNNEFINLNQSHGLGSNSVRDICSDRNGGIVVATTSGLYRITYSSEQLSETNNQSSLTSLFKITPITIPDATDNLMLAVDCDIDGTIWVIANDGKVYSINKNQEITLLPTQGESSETCVSVFCSENGTTYLGTTGHTYYTITGKPGNYLPSLHDSDTISCINHIYEDSTNRIWLISDTGAAYITDTGLFIRIDGLKIDNSLETMIEDYQGNLWICSSRQGVVKLVRSKYVDVNFAAGIDSFTVNSVCLKDQLIYLGTDSGLTILDHSYQPVTNELTKNLEGNRIRQVSVDSKGSLWICTYDTFGLIRVDADETVTYYNVGNQMLESNKVRSCLELTNGDIWVATSCGVTILHNGEPVKHINSTNGIANPVILCMLENTDGKILLGSDGDGIYCADTAGNIVDHYDSSHFDSGVILRITKDKKNGGILISTGVNLYYHDNKSKKFVAFPALNLKGYSIFDIIIPDEDTVYLITSNGVYVSDYTSLMKATDEEYTLNLTKLSDNWGLSSTPTANSWNALTDKGILYLSCSEGLNALNTLQSFTNENLPKISLRSISIDGTEFSPEQFHAITSTHARVTFHVSVLSYTLNRDYYLYYKLDGQDKTFRLLGEKESTDIAYTNLNGGDFHFQAYIQSHDNPDIRSEKLNISFDKRLRFLERPAVQMIILIVLLLTILIIYAESSKRKIYRIKLKQDRYREITNQTIGAITKTIDAKDPNTRGHSQRVAGYSREIAHRLHMSLEDQERIHYIALLHDIGKIGIPDSILTKPEHLTEEEYEVIKQHPTIGGEILKDITHVEDLVVGAKYHHEHYDGTGYPFGLKGEEIPLIARIIGVADSFDTMISDRPYHKAMSTEEVIEELQRCSGSQFDPELVPIMISIIRDSL